MKQKFWSPSLQLIFTVALAFLAAGSLFAADTITMDGKVTEVKILGGTPTTIKIQQAAGIIDYPLARISKVTMAPPAAYATALAAYKAKDYAKAADTLKPLVATFRGLPVDWVQQSAALLGDLYVELNKLPEAEAAYQDFQAAYPGQGSVQTNIGLARIAVFKKDYAEAKAKLAPIVQEALKPQTPNPALAAAFSKALYLQGLACEGEGEFQEALQNYLLVVTLFYHDAPSASAAQEKAAELRKDHNLTVE